MMCKAYGRNSYRDNLFHTMNNQLEAMGMRRNHNSFSLLQNSNIECHKCHNFGHKENKCRLTEATIEPMFLRGQNLSWKRKPSKEECLIALKIQENEDLWYVDSGCSKHMMGNRDKFKTLKKQKGNVTFGDNASGNILGKGTVSIGKDKAKNVLLVENLKPSLLSVN
jgi:hypothetical protein